MREGVGDRLLTQLVPPELAEHVHLDLADPAQVGAYLACLANQQLDRGRTLFARKVVEALSCDPQRAHVVGRVDGRIRRHVREAEGPPQPVRDLVLDARPLAELRPGEVALAEPDQRLDRVAYGLAGGRN